MKALNENFLHYVAIIMLAFIFLSSCQKEKEAKNDLGHLILTDYGPRLVDSYRYDFFSIEPVKINFINQYGNVIAYSSLQHTPQTTNSGCDHAYVTTRVYGGYYLENICFGSSTPSQQSETGIGVYFDIDLPDGISLIADSSTYIKLRLTPSGFSNTTPTGTGFRTLGIQIQYLGSYTLPPPDNILMNKWRLTNNTTLIEENDYCLNHEIQSIFKIKTDCLQIPFIASNGVQSQGLNTIENRMPNYIVSDAVLASRFSVVPAIPLCSPPCLSSIGMVTSLVFRYRKLGSSSWINLYPPDAISSFDVDVSNTGNGTYEYQYKGLIYPDNNIWSPYTPIATVTVL